jgi:hypothetical protein
MAESPMNTLPYYDLSFADTFDSTARTLLFNLTGSNLNDITASMAATIR